MKLTSKQLLMVSFMLFSMFFGAGNLIFPPFLGQNAGSSTAAAIAAFLITAVLLPVLGIIVVAKFDGLEKLSSKVGFGFASIYTVLIYLSIGPGLGIPRAASVPFEMAIAPYLPQGTSSTIGMFLYSLVFFLLAMWLALTPNKLVSRMGKFLTPTLLCLILLLFVSFLIHGHMQIGDPVGKYAENATVVGFLEGYNTMDAIAALNFGLVISLAIQRFGIKEKRSIISTIIRIALIAGVLLSVIYIMLACLGMAASGLYPIQENGAWTLRYIVHDVFGDAGAILLAVIFTIACLTTCVGLITSIAEFFSRKYPRFHYVQYVLGITTVSFLICNLGLTTILSISIPILNAIYPISIVLMIMGLFDRWLAKNRFLYPIVIYTILLESVVSSLDTIHVELGFISSFFQALPFYELGLGWLVLIPLAFLFAYGYQRVIENSRR